MLRRTVRVAFYPVFRYFGPRFASISQRLEALEARAVQETQTISQRLDEFETRVFTDVETTVEVLSVAKRSIGLLERRIEELDELLSQIATTSRRSPDQLVEFAFALHAGVALPPGSRVLVSGSEDEELASCLSAWGHEVVNVASGQDFSGKQAPGAIFHLSAGQSPEAGSGTALDRLAVKRFAEQLAPGGQLVASRPFEIRRGGDSYDAAAIEELLDGYSLMELRLLVRAGSGRWEEVTEGSTGYSEGATAGLALVRAALAG